MTDRSGSVRCWTGSSAAASARTCCVSPTARQPPSIGAILNTRHGTAFHGRPDTEIDARLSVTRPRQRRAIAVHASQSNDNPVPAQRLRLLGDTEHLRLL